MTARENLQATIEQLISDQTTEAIVIAKAEAYREILDGLVGLEKDAETGFTEENVRRYAKMFAIVGEIRGHLGEYKGTALMPPEEIEKLRADRLSPGEVRFLFLAVRMNHALVELEKLKPTLARALLSAKNPESSHKLPF